MKNPFQHVNLTNCPCFARAMEHSQHSLESAIFKLIIIRNYCPKSPKSDYCTPRWSDSSTLNLSARKPQRTWEFLFNSQKHILYSTAPRTGHIRILLVSLHTKTLTLFIVYNFTLWFDKNCYMENEQIQTKNKKKIYSTQIGPEMILHMILYRITENQTWLSKWVKN